MVEEYEHEVNWTDVSQLLHKYHRILVVIYFPFDLRHSIRLQFRKLSDYFVDISTYKKRLFSSLSSGLVVDLLFGINMLNKRMNGEFENDVRSGHIYSVRQNLPNLNS